MKSNLATFGFSSVPTFDSMTKVLKYSTLLLCILTCFAGCQDSATSDEGAVSPASDTADTNDSVSDAQNEADTDVISPLADALSDVEVTPDVTDDAQADVSDTVDIEELSDTTILAADIPFQEGGLLGVYQSPSFGEEGERLTGQWSKRFVRLDPSVDFPGIDASFSEHGTDGVLRVEWAGAFYAEISGEYTFKVTGNDSFRFRLHGEELMEEWDTNEYATASVTLELQKGWHPLELEYESSPGTALMVFSCRKPNGYMEVVPTNLLGTPAIPPTGEDPLGLVEIQVEEVWAYGANLSMKGNTAVKVVAQWTSFDGVKGDVPGTLDQFHSEQAISLILSPGVSYDVVVLVTDVWGREYQTVPLPVQTPDPGEFVLGGLYGSYYDGSEFNSLLMHRLDPQIRLPEDTDGNPNGSFGTPMGGNTFSIRWSGAIWVAETGTYTLYVGGNDGYRFTIDGELLFDSWEVQEANFSQNTAELSQGWHPIQLEYFEATGAASITLEWESPELGIERAPIPSTNLGNSYSFENDEQSPAIFDFSGQANGATSATFEWRASELCTAILFYRIVDDFTQEIIAPEVSIPFDVPATGWKWTVQEIEDGGELVGRVVVKDLLQNSDSSEEVKFEIEGEMEN